MLKLENLSVSYNTVRAVQNVSLTVNDGEIIGIIGLNGSGKTSLVNAIAGLIKSSGRITLDSTDLTNAPPHKRTKHGITLVPEGRHLFQNLTVLENLKTVCNKTQEIYEVYNIFPELKELAHKKAGKLSGGQQQMVALSRAFLAKPKLLLLDEITMGLSPLMTERVFETIYNIGRNFSKIIITGQEIDYITSVSTRVFIMKRGQVFEAEKGRINNEKIF